MEGVDYPKTVAVVDDYMLQVYAIFALDMDKEEDFGVIKAYMDKRLSSNKWRRGPRRRKCHGR